MLSFPGRWYCRVQGLCGQQFVASSLTTSRIGPWCVWGWVG